MIDRKSLRAAALCGGVLAALATAIAPAPATTAETALIPRTAFFGNPERAAGRLSPDGKWLSWLAPRDGVLNVWVAPAGDMAAARPMTDEKKRPASNYFWSADSTQILYATDNDGDENFLLYGVDVATGKKRALTPFQKSRVGVLRTSRSQPDTILISANNRNPQWFDVHSLNLKTGELKLVHQNDGGFASFIADEDLKLRVAVKTRPDGGADVYRFSGGAIEARPFADIPFDDSQTTSPAGFSRDGKVLYWLDSRGRDTGVLVAEDPATGARRVIAEDPRSDIYGAVAKPQTGQVDAYVVNYLKSEWKAADPAVQADLDFLQSRLKGEMGIASRTDADDAWIVVEDPVSAPAAAYRYDRKARTLTRLYVTRPALEGAPLSPMTPVVIKARDGLDLVSYLTLPKGADADGDGRPERPLPMVLVVHGGPWGRDSYGYNGIHQWMANRGYAVLSVNFRGSTGFGKRFISAGDLEWGRKMQDDLTDAVAWAVGGGVARKDKVAIFGGSYGGYAVLAGLAFTPGTYACGVDIVGPSNLNTLLASIPPYWAPIRSQFSQRMGNPDTPEGQALLKERSPLFKADAISAPLLIAQGGNDPRVKKAESDQIAAALKGKSVPVTYLLFPDEGHGFGRPENSLAFFAAAESFLAGCLGGRAEPFGEALKGSSLKVEQGGEHVPGLTAAVGAAAR